MGVKTQDEYISSAQQACKVTAQKVSSYFQLNRTVGLVEDNIFCQDPCWKESKKSMKCLDDNDYIKGKCQREFENYNNCKAFWNTIYWARKRAGKYPLLPESEEERDLFKQKYKETGKIPTEL